MHKFRKRKPPTNVFSFSLIYGELFVMTFPQMNAAEAYQASLVTEVFPDACLDQVWPRIYEWAQMFPRTMLNAKALIKTNYKDYLHQVSLKKNERISLSGQNMRQLSESSYFSLVFGRRT